MGECTSERSCHRSRRDRCRVLGPGPIASLSPVRSGRDPEHALARLAVPAPAWVRFRGRRRPAPQPKATASWQRLGRRMPPGCPLEQQRSAHLLVACQVGRSAGGAAVPAVHAAAGGAGEPKGGRPAAAVVMKQQAGPERIALRPLPLDRPPSINFRARRKWPEQGGGRL